MTVKNIVIVGGGFAGIQVATLLEKALVKANNQQYLIVLIEKKSHFYHAIAGLRSAVNKIPALAKATTTDLELTQNNLRTLRTEIKQAKSIVIVGGGPVGIELAGEIRDYYPKTHVTIVHDQAQFLADSLPKLGPKVAELMQKNHVNVLFNQTVVVPEKLTQSYYRPEQGQVETKSGKVLTDVDLVLLAYGNQPDTAWLKATEVGQQLLSDNGYIKVKPSYQVDHDDLAHMFVLGDAANFNESKLAFRIRTHAPAVVSNVITLAVHNKNSSNLPAQYKKGPDAMFITFGKNGGVGLLPLFGGIVVGNWAVSTLKSKSLFTSQSWKTLNLKEPAV